MYESPSPTTPADTRDHHHTLPELKEDKSGLSDSTPEILTCETNISFSR